MKKLVVFSGATTAFVINLDLSIQFLAARSIGEDLGASLSQVQWLISGFLLPLAAVLMVGGMVSDRFGPGRVLVAGLGLFVAGTVGSALAGGMTVLILMRVFAGLGAALAVPASFAAIRAHLAGRDLTFGLAVWFSGALGATAVGPVLGGLLLAAGPWPLIFWTSGGVALVAVLAAGRVVRRELVSPTAARMRLLPSALGGVGLAAMVWGLINAGERGWDDLSTIGFVLAGLATIAAAGWAARAFGSESSVKGQFDNRRLVGGLLMIGAAVFGIVGSIFFTIIFMQTILEFSPLMTGVALLPFGGVAVILSPISPRLLARFGVLRVLLFAGGLEIAGLVGITFLTVDSSYLTLGPFLMLLGAAMGFLPTISLSLVLAASPRARSGAVSGAHAGALQLGQLISIAIVGSVVAVGVGGAYSTLRAQSGFEPEVPVELVQQISRGAVEDVDEFSGLDQDVHEEFAKAAFVEGMTGGVRVSLFVTLLASAILAGVLRGRLSISTPMDPEGLLDQQQQQEAGRR